VLLVIIVLGSNQVRAGCRYFGASFSTSLDNAPMKFEPTEGVAVLRTTWMDRGRHPLNPQTSPTMEATTNGVAPGGLPPRTQPMQTGPRPMVWNRAFRALKPSSSRLCTDTRTPNPPKTPTLSAPPPRWLIPRNHWKSEQADWQVPDSRSAWFWSQVVIDTDFS
jgi:hypothetical protein